MEKLKISIQIFSYLRQAMWELNYIFSVPVFLILTIKLISIISCVFAFVFTTFKNVNTVLRSTTLIMISTALTDCAKIFIILSAADLPLYQVNKS